MGISDDIKKILRKVLLTIYNENDWGCEDYILGVNLVLKNDMNAIKLINYIDDNKNINSDDVIFKAFEIAGELDNILEKSAD